MQPNATKAILTEGEIVRWHGDKGFGFIRPAAGGQDIFVHITALKGDQAPTPGSRWLVSTEPDPKGRGLRALKAVPASGQFVHGSAQSVPGVTEAELRARRRHAHRTAPVDRSAKQRRQAQTPRGTNPRGDRQTARPKGNDQSEPRPRRQRVHRLRMDLKTWFVIAATLFCCIGALSTFAVTGWMALAYLAVSAMTYVAYIKDKSKALKNQWRIPESTLHGLEILGGWPGAYVAQQTLRHKTVKGSYQAIYWLIVLGHLAGWGFWLWYQA